MSAAFPTFKVQLSALSSQFGGQSPLHRLCIEPRSLTIPHTRARGTVRQRAQGLLASLVLLVGQGLLRSVRPPAPEICRWGSLQPFSHDPVQQDFRFARELAGMIASPYLSAASRAVEASFWKRGSFRSGSNMGSSRSSAGVSGGSCPKSFRSILSARARRRFSRSAGRRGAGPRKAAVLVRRNSARATRREHAVPFPVAAMLTRFRPPTPR